MMWIVNALWSKDVFKVFHYSTNSRRLESNSYKMLYKREWEPDDIQNIRPALLTFVGRFQVSRVIRVADVSWGARLGYLPLNVGKAGWIFLDFDLPMIFTLIILRTILHSVLES